MPLYKYDSCDMCMVSQCWIWVYALCYEQIADNLQKKMRNRPGRDNLMQMNILPGQHLYNLRDVGSEHTLHIIQISVLLIDMIDMKSSN